MPASILIHHVQILIIKCSAGDITQRVCTAAEIKAYFNSIQTRSAMKPNTNCNRTSWHSGCEPGWACSINSDQLVDLKNYHYIPARTLDCQSCCAGFFCPRGLTCMIRKYTRKFWIFLKLFSWLQLTTSVHKWDLFSDFFHFSVSFRSKHKKFPSFT